MSEYVKVHGVVLLSTPYKEYDNRIELLTMEYGRITVFIRGARRQGSRSAASSIPFTFAEYELYQGRDAYSYHSSVIIKYFSTLSEDFDIMCHASYFAEMARYFSRENVEAKSEVNLLYFSFLALEKGVVNSSLIRRIFELRMLYIQGIGPNVYECVICREKKKNMNFSVKRGGLICDDCIRKEEKNRQMFGNTITLNNDTIYTMQFIASTNIKKLFSFNLSDDIFAELERILDAYYEVHVGYKFKSLNLLP